MHSEIHALTALPSREAARGCECWIVELDGHGVGYEEAHPCPMCNKGIHMLGLARVHYSSHTGVKSAPVAFRPQLRCESYEAALQRRYPEGTAEPRESSPGFDLASFTDPGRGRSAAAAARAASAAE
jgi:hypothetical protein